ncbi:hypothetical protein BO83DRAFT_365537 [Aspergillus eucalypticola CBS 122712]|uniref:Eukaryotic translation initiation factor 3 subunit M n=1 Tax=Aspergillus eucalypticola (strain CBS 122712 / IBT 29274) TaxID=1448314 RepID=A0A317V6C4_ASPEC|nr:uncharacterized protein BO83DRAFT_365537 [Aspergillus eucalypticola CBS 122712]PWY67690.1 hypothetical protein BO83DRAFT_365537 [Aspergillus eucalypticola CBS 122712]
MSRRSPDAAAPRVFPTLNFLHRPNPFHRVSLATPSRFDQSPKPLLASFPLSLPSFFDFFPSLFLPSPFSHHLPSHHARPSTTLLIEGSFTELADEFAQYIDALRKSEASSSLQSEISPLLQPLREQEQSEAEPDRKQRDEVLKKLVSAAVVLNSAPEKEIISAYNLLVHLVHQASDPDMFLSRICTYLAKPISSSPQFGPSLAISILSTIFNTLAPSDSSRYHVLLATVAVIRQSSSSIAFDALKSQLVAQLPSWLAAWELDADEAQRLHLAIADAAQASGDPELAQTHVVQALQTIPAANASAPEARDLAVRALTSALTHPAVFDFTPLTASDAVQALRSSDSTLFELLEIFTADTLDAYEAFISATPLASISGGVLAEAGEALQNKMRLLTLASLAASTPSRSLPYATIATALRVEPTDVEKWVIDTIRAGLVEGKLSQLRSEFLVHRATYRVFGEKQWAEVQGRLMVWRRSLENVLGVVRSERERFVREGLQAAQAAEEAAQGKGNDKKGGDRRRHNNNNNNNQQQQQQQQQAPAAPAAAPEAVAVE